MVKADIRRILEGEISPEAVREEEESARWAVGGRLPQAVVMPESVEEGSRVLALGHRHGWRIHPAGLGTWLGGGGPWPPADVVLSTARLQGVGDHEPADFVASVRAGTSLGGLSDLLSRHGQWVPLDPPGGRVGSVGAAVALGVGGGLSHGFGGPRELVLGLSAVAGDGRVLTWGGRVMKNVAGFDMTRLMVGSWGELGLVAEVTFRLFPLPPEDATLLVSAPRAEDLLEVASVACTLPLPLTAVELFDPLPLPEGSGEGAETKRPAALVLRFLGSPGQVREAELRFRSLLKGKALSHRRGLARLDRDESRALQEAMESWEEGGEMVLRAALLPARLGELVTEARHLSHLPGRGGEPPLLALAAHVPRGILRVRVQGVPETGRGLREWAVMLGEWRTRLRERGGSLTLSLAPPALTGILSPWQPLGPEGPLMEGVRQLLDPGGILPRRRVGE